MKDEIYEFLKGKYVKIESPKQSKEIQKIAFLGEFSWNYHLDTIAYTDKPILYFETSTYLAYGESDDSTHTLSGITYSEVTYLEIINFYNNLSNIKIMTKKKANIWSDDDGTTYLPCPWEQNEADKLKIFTSLEECVTYCEENNITAIF